VTFWRDFRARFPEVDIVVDDGAHEARFQVPPVEALLPHLRPGGIYLCEDVHGTLNGFHLYACGLSRQLNESVSWRADLGNPERRIVCLATPFQAAVQAVHFHPYVVVIERRETAAREFACPKRGTRWQPFGQAWDAMI
jgi:hypothetical protein